MTTLQPQPRNIPTPADPHLASSLIDDSDLASLLAHITTPTHAPPRAEPPQHPLTSLLSASSHKAITALSGATLPPLTSLALTHLITHLLSSSDSSAAVIDTTGNFDVVGLYAGILKRLDGEGLKKEHVAAEVLGRIRIMRIFDFEGLEEAVGELRVELRDDMLLRNGVDEEKEEHVGGTEEVVVLEQEEVVLEQEEVVLEQEEVVLDQKQKENEYVPLKNRTEVADSEDEDEDGDIEEEMLFDARVSTEPAPAHAPAPAPILKPTAACYDASSADQQNQPSSRLKLIIIDNLAHVLTPFLKKDTIQANVRATIFLASLADLTRTHGLHTLLLNPCAMPPASSARRPSTTSTTTSTTTPTTAITTATTTPTPLKTHIYVPPPSIFTSQTSVPALLGLLSRYTDVHMLVSELPLGKMDGRVYYGEAGGRERGKRRGVEMGCVVEVIGERWGGGVGAWGTFQEKSL